MIFKIKCFFGLLFLLKLTLLFMTQFAGVSLDPKQSNHLQYLSVSPEHIDHHLKNQSLNFDQTQSKRRQSQTTASSFQQSSQQSKEIDMNSNIISLRSECKMDDNKCSLSKNKSCSSIQNSTLVSNQITNYFSDRKQYTIKSHNQYYMQKIERHPSASLSQTTSHHSELSKAQKHTPSTDHSDSESSSKGLQETSTPAKAFLLTAIQQASTASEKMKLSEEKNKKIKPSSPKKGIYYRNRSRLIDWMKVECKKLELSRQTFANSIFLMDQYYKHSSFNSHQFLPYALCMLVIASKMNETKVLYTEKIAKNNSLDVEKMMGIQLKLIEWFKYKVDPYNYARILTEYMKRWDQVVQRNKLQVPMFFQRSENSLELYLQMFYICECQLKENRQILISTIKIIFQEFFLQKKVFIFQEVIDNVFYEINIFAKHEKEYVFQWKGDDNVSQQTYRSELRVSIGRWMEEFIEKKNQFFQKCSKLKSKNVSYATILSLQI